VTDLRPLSCLRRVGALIISESSLTTLLGLESLASADSLSIARNPVLENLDGIGQLEVTGSVYVEANPALENIEGLTGLRTLSSTLILSQSPLLTDLEGLRNLTWVRDWLELSDLSGLTSLGGLRSLSDTRNLLILRNAELRDLEGLGGLVLRESEGGLLQVHDNALLESLAGLSRDNTTPPYLFVAANPSLTDLTGLEHIVRCTMLDVSDNVGLTSLAGLENLQRLSELDIQRNAQLASLAGLASLERIENTFRVTGNPELRSCEAQALSERVGYTPNVTIYGNDEFTGCR
jgi:hypothetical protein